MRKIGRGHEWGVGDPKGVRGGGRDNTCLHQGCRMRVTRRRKGTSKLGRDRRGGDWGPSRKAEFI